MECDNIKCVYCRTNGEGGKRDWYCDCPKDELVVQVTVDQSGEENLLICKSYAKDPKVLFLAKKSAKKKGKGAKK